MIYVAAFMALLGVFLWCVYLNITIVAGFLKIMLIVWASLLGGLAIMKGVLEIALFVGRRLGDRSGKAPRNFPV